jgi:hypothetical protein
MNLLKLVRALASAALLLPIALIGSSCATTKLIPCTNDGECTTADPNLSYCSRSRCVECVSASSCGDGNLCVDGMCQRKCKDERQCREHEQCSDGICAPS